MMSFSTTAPEAITPCNELEEEVFQACQQCEQSYLVKYWDNELDWYIEINTSNHCPQCKPNHADLGA